MPSGITSPKKNCRAIVNGSKHPPDFNENI